VLLDLQGGKDAKGVPAVAASYSLHQGTQKEHSHLKPLAEQIPAQVVSDRTHVENHLVCAIRSCAILSGS